MTAEHLGEAVPFDGATLNTLVNTAFPFILGHNLQTESGITLYPAIVEALEGKARCFVGVPDDFVVDDYAGRLQQTTGSGAQSVTAVLARTGEKKVLFIDPSGVLEVFDGNTSLLKEALVESRKVNSIEVGGITFNDGHTYGTVDLMKTMIHLLRQASSRGENFERFKQAYQEYIHRLYDRHSS